MKIDWKTINPKPFLLVAFICFGYGAFIFSIGLHNVDLSYNMALIVNDNNIEKESYDLPLNDYRDALDQTIGDTKITYMKSYTMGLSQMVQGTMMMIFSAIFFTFLLNTLYRQ